MTWFKVDDKFATHPKVRDAGPEAIGLWTMAGSHCANHLTDGLVTRRDVVHLVGRKGLRLAEHLVKVGLWHQVGEDFSFHDWEEYQPTKAQELAKRRADSARKARGFRSDSKRGPAADSDRIPTVPTRPDPTRPVPNEIPPSEGGARSGLPAPEEASKPDEVDPFPLTPSKTPSVTTPVAELARGKRISADWQPSPEVVEKLRSEGLDARKAVPEFVDHWLAVPGAKGLKTNWDSTFRNHVRKLRDWGRPPKLDPSDMPSFRAPLRKVPAPPPAQLELDAPPVGDLALVLFGMEAR